MTKEQIERIEDLIYDECYSYEQLECLLPGNWCLRNYDYDKKMVLNVKDYEVDWEEFDVDIQDWYEFESPIWKKNMGTDLYGYGRMGGWLGCSASVLRNHIIPTEYLKTIQLDENESLSDWMYDLSLEEFSKCFMINSEIIEYLQKFKDMCYSQINEWRRLTKEKESSNGRND